MKNDLTPFEKNLLKVINMDNATNYNYRHLMEWSNVRKIVEGNLLSDETIYEACGVYVAIKNK